MAEELDGQQVDETTEEVKEDETPVETPEPSYADVLKKYQLDKRWKSDDPMKLVEDMGQSFVNAEQALRQREQENAEMRHLLYQKYNSEPQKEVDTNEPDEVKQAKKFVRDEAEQLLVPLRQENEALKARVYIVDRMNHPSEVAFKQVVESGELKWAMGQLGLPLSEQNLDRAFKELMYYKSQQNQAQTIQQAKEAGAEIERDKSKAFVETGGKPVRSKAIPSDEEVRRAAKNMTEAEFDAYLTKYGIKLG